MAPLTLPALLCGGLCLLTPLLSVKAERNQEGDKVVAPSASVEADPQAIEAALSDLRKASDKEFVPALEAAYAVFRDRALQLDFEPAIVLGEGMHNEILRRGESYLLTSGWSATQLALAYTRAGQHADSERVLSERVEVFETRLAELRGNSEPAQSAGLIRGLNDLLDRRAMDRLAAGDEAGGLADLGGGLARGSRNARLILGRRALRNSQATDPASTARSELSKIEARRLFSTLLDEEPGVAAWALRGWGLTLLPPSRPQ